MTIDTFFTISVGSAATLFLLSCSRWLWRHAPAPHDDRDEVAQAYPPRAYPPQTYPPQTYPPQAPNDHAPEAPAPVEPVPAPLPFQPVQLASAGTPAPEIDGARTMFFLKKKPTADATELISDELEAAREFDAPVANDQLQTAPTRRAGGRRDTLPPPPPNRR